MPHKKCNICGFWENTKQLNCLSSSTYDWYHQYVQSSGVSFDIDDLHYCKSCPRSLYSIKTSGAQAPPSPARSFSIESMALDDVNGDDQGCQIQILEIRDFQRKIRSSSGVFFPEIRRKIRRVSSKVLEPLIDFVY